MIYDERGLLSVGAVPEILVTAPEILERIFGEWCLFSSLQDVLYCNVLCTSHCVVFMMLPLSQDRF